MVETPSTSDDFRDETLFKVHVNFSIDLFEGQIDTNALEKWLNLLKSYYSIKKQFDSEKMM
jgi:hypothetical protein